MTIQALLVTLFETCGPEENKPTCSKNMVTGPAPGLLKGYWLKPPLKRFCYNRGFQTWFPLEINILLFEFKIIAIHVRICFNLDKSAYVVCVLKIPLVKAL